VGSKDAINKAKGVEICAKLLYEGKQRADIVQHFAKSFGIKARTADNYIKGARQIVKEWQERDEEIRAKVQAEQTEEVCRRLGISREWAMTRLKQFADLDIRKIYNEDGTMKKISELDDDTARAISSIEVTEVRTADGKLGLNKKLKGESRTAAIAKIGELAGWTGTTAKVEVTSPAGKGQTAKKISVTLNLS